MSGSAASGCRALRGGEDAVLVRGAARSDEEEPTDGVGIRQREDALDRGGVIREDEEPIEEAADRFHGVLAAGRRSLDGRIRILFRLPGLDEGRPGKDRRREP
jgi:hypothetical protein